MFTFNGFLYALFKKPADAKKFKQQYGHHTQFEVLFPFKFQIISCIFSTSQAASSTICSPRISTSANLKTNQVDPKPTASFAWGSHPNPNGCVFPTADMSIAMSASRNWY